MLDIEELRKLDSEELAKELRKFSPERRLKVLKELEDSRKKDLKKTEELIIESIDELTEEPKEPELPKQPDIDLESAVNVKPVEDEIESVEYAVNAYNELKNLLEDQGDLNVYRVGELYHKIKQTEKYIGPTEEMKGIMQSSREMVRQAMGDFYADQEYHP